MNSAHQIYRYFNPAHLGEDDTPSFTFVAFLGPVLLTLFIGVLLAVSNHLALSGSV